MLAIQHESAGYADDRDRIRVVDEVDIRHDDGEAAGRLAIGADNTFEANEPPNPMFNHDALDRSVRLGFGRATRVR